MCGDREGNKFGWGRITVTTTTGLWRDKDVDYGAGPPDEENDGRRGWGRGLMARVLGVRSPGPGEVGGRGLAPRPRPCSPCQLRRASDRSERPEGARGGCSRNRRGPDTSSESSAVKKVADGTSGHRDQLRSPGSETAMAAIALAPAPAPARHPPVLSSFRLPAAVSPGNSGGGGRKPRLPEAPPRGELPNADRPPPRVGGEGSAPRLLAASPWVPRRPGWVPL